MSLGFSRSTMIEVVVILLTSSCLYEISNASRASSEYIIKYIFQTSTHQIINLLINIPLCILSWILWSNVVGYWYDFLFLLNLSKLRTKMATNTTVKILIYIFSKLPILFHFRMMSLLMNITFQDMLNWNMSCSWPNFMKDFQGRWNHGG